MKKVLVLSILLTFIFMSNLSASNYKLDNAKVDSMFENTQEVSYSALFQDLGVESSFPMASTVVKQNEGAIAFILCSFLWYFGAHRFYLGTEPLTGIAYIFTCGGCGVVAAIDWVVLLIDMNDVSAYVNNPKFFMWN